jgi:hypothetical protein
MRTSKIKKTISRLIRTADFENVNIALEVEDTIEWETPQERLDKSDNYTKLLVADFMKSLDRVSTALNFDKKVATVTAPSAKKNNQSFLEE